MKRLLLAVTSLCAAGALGDGIVSSKHNLSVSGPGPIRATEETQICIFCHVGHSSAPMGQNRPDSRALYRPYESTTMKSALAYGPTGATRVCLSCHDGTIALGETLVSGTIAISGADPSGRLPQGASNLGTDLRKTHPVSIVPQPSPTLKVPSGESHVKLDANRQLQCTACHDPHREDLDPVRKKFLTRSNRFSELCLTCHALPYWQSNPSAHQASLAPIAGRDAARYPYPTVAENGCEACHQSHDASENGRLLRARASDRDEQVCLSCHDGVGARTDIAGAVARPSSHLDAAKGERVHDASEGPHNPRFQLPERRSSAPRHATCVDCHNPHAAFAQDAAAPKVKGANAGTWGVDLSGEAVDPVRFEYELCFKCHGDSANQPLVRGGERASPRRATPEPNLRLAFAPDAPSAHPVTGPGRAVDVPSLLPPLTPASLIYCTDCHGSDARGGASAKGPHGSSFPFLLERNLATADHSLESPQAYALCYKCHDREVLLSDRSAFRPHRLHVVDSATPCTACHTSHGVAPLQGNPVNNAHLVDFDLGIVKATPGGVRSYTSTGPRRGTCTVACHGATHQRTPY